MKQNANGDLGTSKIGSEDRSSGYRNSTNSTGMPEGNQTTTEQTAKSDVGTSKDGSEDRSEGYKNSTSSEDMPEVNQTTTTDLSTSSDSRNTSGSIVEQTTDSDFSTSTVASKDHSSGFESSTSSERVPEVNRANATELSTSPGAGSAESASIVYIVLLACSICIIFGLSIWIYILILSPNNWCSDLVATPFAFRPERRKD